MCVRFPAYKTCIAKIFIRPLNILVRFIVCLLKKLFAPFMLRCFYFSSYGYYLCVNLFFRTKAGTVVARVIIAIAIICPSVRHTGGSVKNDAS